MTEEEKERERRYANAVYNAAIAPARVAYDKAREALQAAEAAYHAKDRACWKAYHARMKEIDEA